MNDPFELARQIAERQEISAAAERWILGAFAAWYRDGSDPRRMAWAFQIPTGARWATTKRDAYLREAAGELLEHKRGAELKSRIDIFLKSTWPRWRELEGPPADADSVEQFLFFAAKTGAPMRLCRRRINGILAGK